MNNLCKGLRGEMVIQYERRDDETDGKPNGERNGEEVSLDLDEGGLTLTVCEACSAVWRICAVHLESCRVGTVLIIQ